MSTAHPDRRFVEADSWTATGSKTEMLDTFADFCPRVQKLLRLVPEGDVLEWKLRVHEPLTHWTDGSVALVGDACHPTLPHLAQGAAQAVEDAAVLGVVLGQVQNLEDLPKALLAYQVSIAARFSCIVNSKFVSNSRRCGSLEQIGQYILQRRTAKVCTWALDRIGIKGMQRFRLR